MYDAPLSASCLRMAVASRDGLRVDQHFGQAEEFLVYDVDGDNAKLVESRKVADHAQGDEDPRQTIIRMLGDCNILLVAKIGPTPQEQLAAIGIEATDMYKGKSIPAALAEIHAAKAAVDPNSEVDGDGFRLLHAMLRVTDMDRSLDFYTRMLGMQVLGQREHKKNQFTQAYLGYGAGGKGMALELVFNWSGDEPYTRGTSFGHIAIQVTAITALCDRLVAEGVPLPRPPRTQRHGENIVAFIEDPDGNRIELVQVPKP